MIETYYRDLQGSLLQTLQVSATKRIQETVNACQPGTIHSYFQLHRPWPTMEPPGLSRKPVGCKLLRSEKCENCCFGYWCYCRCLFKQEQNTQNIHAWSMIMHKYCINDHTCTMVTGLMQWAWVWKKQLLHSTCFDHIRYGHHMTPYFLLYIHILQSKLHERKQPAMLPANHYVHPWRGHMSGLVWQLDVTSTLSVHSSFFFLFLLFYCITCEQVILSSYCFLFGLETPNSAKRSLVTRLHHSIAIYCEIGGRKIAQSAASIR